MDKAGIHIIANFFGCTENTNLLIDKDGLNQTLSEIVRKNKMNILSDSFYKFPEGGVTGFLLLAESHVSIHTWPERDNYFSFDVFVCNYTKDNTESAKKILEDVKEIFKPKKVEEQFVERN
jgi:S-adenosylmethionine decarboxylase proenzyme